MRWIGMIAVAAAMAASSAGCASTARSGEATDTAPPFSGTWAVRWCNEARPDLECGGFWVTLVQTGPRVCGEYGGARVNFAQVDEGRVTGIASGNTAQLRVRSDRNQTVVEVQAKRVGEDLHWTQGDTIERGGNDISIIAIEDILVPSPASALASPEACQ